MDKILSNRKLFVKYDDTMSDMKDVQMRVSQGSVLGPLLCTIIYVNDLPTFIAKGRVTMFADDATITVSAQDPEELSERWRALQFPSWSPQPLAFTI